MTIRYHLNTFKVILAVSSNLTAIIMLNICHYPVQYTGSKFTSTVLGLTFRWQWQMCSRHLCSTVSCPAASFALVIFWLRAAAVVVAAGRGWRTEASAGTTLPGCLTGTRGRVWNGNGAGARAHVEYRGGDGAGAAAPKWLFLEVFGKVLMLLWGVRAAAEREHPAELHIKEGAQTWGHIQLPKYILVAGHHLTQPDAAKVLQSGGRGAGTDHLHAAFGCCGAHHGIELLVLQLCSSDAYSRRQKQFRRIAEISNSTCL